MTNKNNKRIQQEKIFVTLSGLLINNTNAFVRSNSFSMSPGFSTFNSGNGCTILTQSLNKDTRYFVPTFLACLEDILVASEAPLRIDPGSFTCLDSNSVCSKLFKTRDNENRKKKREKQTLIISSISLGIIPHQRPAATGSKAG